MARKQRTLASFDQVANTGDEKEDIKDISKDKVKDDKQEPQKEKTTPAPTAETTKPSSEENSPGINEYSDFQGVLDSIVHEKEKKSTRKLVGIYFDDDLAEILDKYGKKGGRGAKSKIVNDFVRIGFKELGLLKEE